MIDPFGRDITYLRVSVTDRCDFRCTYCMAEDMTFLPKADLLTLEELDRLCSVFIAKGVRKLRLTGGEPLVRKNVMWLIERLGRHLKTGALDELTMTTNGSQLARHAGALAAAGVRRINVSLDTLDEALFARITRWGRLQQVLDGIEAALAAGLKVKINTVALRDANAPELPHLIAWAHGRGMDLTLIETMPMGDVPGRVESYLPLDELLSASRFVSLHAPNIPENRGLMGAAQFARMRKGAFFINTSRGALVDENALYAALDDGHLGGAGLDVHAAEPRQAGDRFAKFDNVVLTPHVGGGSLSGIVPEMAAMSENIANAIAGIAPRFGRVA